MGCCSSIPHTKRRYRDPADLDEEIIPLREFGNYRNGLTNLVPNDIDGLPSTHIYEHLATDPDTLLYEADIDQGRAYRCFRPWWCVYLLPHALLGVAIHGIQKITNQCTCDESVCWLRKEYSTRTFFRVFPNRIEVNYPGIRLFGVLGCGSWNEDRIRSFPFDRGAFGFRPVKCGIHAYLCCIWPVYGQSVARQRCQCNGSLWPRLLDCGGWWCDEWMCDMCCCTYRYEGLADADETAFAAGIALQAYYEGRVITPDDMQKCIRYWKVNISEMEDPVGRKRDVCCEPFCIPCCTCLPCYQCTHHHRNNPFDDEEDPECTAEWMEVYNKYVQLREKQIHNYKTFIGPVRNSTLCRAAGCKRVFGRRGLIFCTEGCCSKTKKKDEPAPPFTHRDIDDENDASVILQRVCGDPPRNVVYHRWKQEIDEGNGLEIVAYQP